MPTSLLDPHFQKPAAIDHPIHELLRHRWSPRALSPEPVSRADLHTLFEALRWTPSASNEQPWTFLVATRDEPEAFDGLLACLNPGNQAWARNAYLLVVTVARRDLAAKPQPNRTSHYDLGQAMACLTVQATALGLAVHQMAGMNLEASRTAGQVPGGYEPVTAVAIGYPAESSTLPEELRKKDAAPRVRKPLREFVFGAQWGQPAPWLNAPNA